MLTFNFSSYYLNPELSDVAIKIASGGAVLAELPGHGIVLANVSTLFKEQIDESSVVLLGVEQDPLQATGARALVQYVYQGILPGTGQQALLVHVLHLAHKFAVHSCRAACLEALMAIDEQALQLDAIHVVFSLLSETAYHGFAPLIQHCLRRLQRQLGDLEATLSDQHLLSCLQQLPLEALLALLHDERTSAASENTVLAAVQSWLGAQPAEAPVTPQQLQQLASAIRIPLLEPMYMATVLPRIPWLLDILGPGGLAMAAGAARGMCDPHVEPCLSNPRACGGLAAAWLKGTRPMPASCNSEEQDGPQISIHWSLPMAQVKHVFEATCAAAAAAAAAKRKAEAEAAAARLQRASEPAASGQQSWTASSAAGAVSAAAAAAVNFGTSMFRKRKRTAEQQDHDCAAAASKGALQVTAAGTEAAESVEVTRSSSSRKQRCGVGAAAEHPNTPEQQAAAVARTNSIRGAACGDAGNVGAPAAAELHPTHQQQVLPAPHQPLKAYSDEVQFAGYTWRLVLYFQQAGTQPTLERAAALGRGSGGSGSGSGGQQARAAGIALAAGVHSQQPQQAQQQQDIFRAVGAMDYLGCLQTPGGSKRARRAGAAAAAAGGAAAASAVEPRQWSCTGARFFGFGRRGGPALQAVEAAAAMGLPDDGAGSPVRTNETHTARSTGDAAAGADTAVADDDARGLVWHAKLAIEAWPCIALQPGVSTAAFSGSLAVRLGTSGGEVAAAAATAVGQRGRRAGFVAGAGRTNSQPRSQHYQHMGGTPALKGRLLAGQQQQQHAGTGATAAAIVRAPRSSSTAIAEAAAVGSARAPHSKRAAAVAAAAKIAAGGDTVPESDDADEYSEQEEEDDDVQLIEHEDQEESVEHEQEEGLQAPAPVGTAGRHRSRSAAAAAAGQGSEHGSAPVRQTRDASRASIGSIGQDDGDAADSDGIEAEAVAANHGPAGKRTSNTAGQAGAAGVAGAETSRGSWLVFQLPQSSWVKSRRCDTGFRDFFGVQMHQAQWDEAAWSRYLQPGGALNLKGTIWNVR